MLFVISPAKTLDYESQPNVAIEQTPQFLMQSAELVEIIRSYPPQKLSELMHISDQLAVLNSNRFAEWSLTPAECNTRAAICAFNGDVYEGLNVASLTGESLGYLKTKLRILSGLYGVLRPSDALQAYRLEMGIPLKNSKGKNLYEFWRSTVTTALNKDIAALNAQVLVNLASEEYFKVVDTAKLNTPVVTPVFEEGKQGKFKVVSFHAKRARGLMVRYACENNIQDVSELTSFDVEGYTFHKELSTATRMVFRR